MDLNTLWFALIAILWIGYLFLEGFDFGVGMLLPIVGRTDPERSTALRSIGPVWDGNEVWLLVAGGATFAAFPDWYATLFSGFYLALFLILAALIGRGVALEYRNKSDDARWRRNWDIVIVAGSALPALLWGVAFTNIVHGVPVDAHKEYTGTLLDLLNPYALAGGVVSLGLFALHGANFLCLRTDGAVRERATATAKRLSWPVAGVVLAFLVWTYVNGEIGGGQGVDPGIVPVAALGAIIATPFLVRSRHESLAFAGTGLTIALLVLTLFLNLYPRVLVSSIDPAFSLTIHNAASSAYTLTVMTVVAVLFTPVVLAYQAWTYWVFRRRLTTGEFSGFPLLRAGAPIKHNGTAARTRP